MIIKGRFYNEAKNITITINGDNTYSLSGLNGYETAKGEFGISDGAGIFDYPFTFNFKRAENSLNVSVIQIPVKLIDDDTFSTIYNAFCTEDFSGLLKPAIFKRAK